MLTGADALGIVAAAVHIPRGRVDLSQLERVDGCVGKYTIGLGQQSMSVVDPAEEDAISMAMTALLRLRRKCPWLQWGHVGCIEVGTESNPDRAKSIKSHLMAAVGREGGEILGVDSQSACYGGTAALFRVLDWMGSEECGEKRFGIVVMSDVAVYGDEGSAKATGGAGAVALLIGANAPLVVERGLWGAHAEHIWDFWKSAELPAVDGPLSIRSYLRALDVCYGRYRQRAADLHPDCFVFHTPYAKLAQKAYSSVTGGADLGAFEPALRFSRQVGNIYCGSLYLSLLSLVRFGRVAVHSRIGMFSYGSGCMAKFFSVKVRSGDLGLLEVDVDCGGQDYYRLLSVDDLGRRRYELRH